jgi:hypothetical protein
LVVLAAGKVAVVISNLILLTPLHKIQRLYEEGSTASELRYSHGSLDFGKKEYS